MNIQGFQKLTLLDYPEKVACTIFTGGCNFRCPFCHNASLVTKPLGETFDEEEIFSYLKKRIGILEGVCITGGEPLIQSDIKSFIKKVKQLGYSVKLDTNGSFPDKLLELINEKLIDYVAMDVKNCKRKYNETIGLKNYDTSAVYKSLEILKSNIIPYELRTTVIREFHTAKDLSELAAEIKFCRNYFLQGFVDSGDLICSGLSGFTDDEMQDMLKVVKKEIPTSKIRGVE